MGLRDVTGCVFFFYYFIIKFNVIIFVKHILRFLSFELLIELILFQILKIIWNDRYSIFVSEKIKLVKLLNVGDRAQLSCLLWLPWRLSIFILVLNRALLFGCKIKFFFFDYLILNIVPYILNRVHELKFALFDYHVGEVKAFLNLIVTFQLRVAPF